MRNFLVLLLLPLFIFSSAFAEDKTDCRLAHEAKAIRVASNQWSIQNSNPGPTVVGSYWVALGVGFAPSLLVTSPLVIGASILAGGTLAGSQIIDSIREPRYSLLSQMLLRSEGNPSLEYENSKVYKRLLRKAQNAFSKITSEELLAHFVEGIDSGRFCTAGGRPFTFKRMEREVLRELK